MKILVIPLLAIVSLSAAQASETFTGRITDSMCGGAGHASMQMGPTDAECTAACVDTHGAVYVLYDGKSTYELSDQEKAAGFSGRRVRVTGTLDAKRRLITVETIAGS